MCEILCSIFSFYTIFTPLDSTFSSCSISIMSAREVSTLSCSRHLRRSVWQCKLRKTVTLGDDLGSYHETIFNRRQYGSSERFTQHLAQAPDEDNHHHQYLQTLHSVQSFCFKFNVILRCKYFRYLHKTNTIVYIILSAIKLPMPLAP